METVSPPAVAYEADELPESPDVADAAALGVDVWLYAELLTPVDASTNDVSISAS